MPSRSRGASSTSTKTAASLLAVCLAAFASTAFSLLWHWNSPSMSFGAGNDASAAVADAPTRTRKRTSGRIPGRPPIDEIVSGWNVTGDASWLLDFAIIGFPKAGTTTMMNYLNTSEFWVPKKEQCQMLANYHVPLMRKLYDESPPLGNIKRGIKCPRDFTKLSMKNYKAFFPHTKFIVGVRHPIRWFESFYNFRVNNAGSMPPPEDLIGSCTGRTRGCCTDRGKFHLSLSLLGKTPRSEKERRLFGGEDRLDFSMPNDVFLFDVAQLSDANATRADEFREDLGRYLGAERPLGKMIRISPGKELDTEEQAERDRLKIDICDSRHEKVRSVLLEIASNASRWIREYFLNGDGVFVSSRYFLEQVLRDWERDPCISAVPTGPKN